MWRSQHPLASMLPQDSHGLERPPAFCWSIQIEIKDHESVNSLMRHTHVLSFLNFTRDKIKLRKEKVGG